MGNWVDQIVRLFTDVGHLPQAEGLKRLELIICDNKRDGEMQ